MVFDKKTEVKHNYDDKVFAEINKVLKPWSFMDMMTTIFSIKRNGSMRHKRNLDRIANIRFDK